MKFTLSAVLLLILAATGGGRAQRPLPPGFDMLTDAFWGTPWVFDAAAMALPAAHYAIGRTTTSPLSIRLDDDTRGTLRAESRPCAPGDDCEPFDCGCPLDDESFWVEVVDGRGESVARMHLWAAYGIFDIVPVDLVGGPGDELVIVRIPAHASPPVGHDLKIWSLGRTKPVDLVERIKVAGLFDTQPIGCARWRMRLVIDVTAVKPRNVSFESRFAARRGTAASSAACWLPDTELTRHASLKRGYMLRFDQGRYRPNRELPGESR